MVTLNLRRKPGGARCCANEAEDGRRLDGAPFHRLVVENLYRLKVAVAFHATNSRIADQFDVRGLTDALYQVARHVLVQVVAADEQHYVPRMSGEKDGGLSCGISAADYD